jgi:hypothetical protein
VDTIADSVTAAPKTDEFGLAVKLTDAEVALAVWTESVATIKARMYLRNR